MSDGACVVDEAARKGVDALETALNDFKLEARGADQAMREQTGQDFRGVKDELSELRKVFAGRPTWGVTVTIGGLMSLVTALATVLVGHLVG